jgi:hypothetical protein
MAPVFLTQDRGLHAEGSNGGLGEPFLSENLLAQLVVDKRVKP